MACEFSGIVRDAFLKLGHDALSCDVLPTERPGPHYQGDVRDVLRDDWDMVVAFPPCTYLCSSGLHWNSRRRGRAAKTKEALAFVRLLMDTPVRFLALENPVGCISTQIRKPDQVVQPWMFGHPESKTTCLWLRGLPPLKATRILTVPDSGRWANQTPTGQNNLSPSPDRWKDRSRTYTGLARAMAVQWSAAVFDQLTTVPLSKTE